MLEKEEAIYGLGILQNGKMSQRNQRKYLMPGNVEDGITFFQSVKGYGLSGITILRLTLLMMRMRLHLNRKLVIAQTTISCMVEMPMA